MERGACVHRMLGQGATWPGFSLLALSIQSHCVFVQRARRAFAAAEDGERSPALKLDGVEKMDLPNGQSGVTTTAATVSEVRPCPHLDHAAHYSLCNVILLGFVMKL